MKDIEQLDLFQLLEEAKKKEEEEKRKRDGVYYNALGEPLPWEGVKNNE